MTLALVQYYLAVQIQMNEQLPANISVLIRQVIVVGFQGEDGGIKARIGSTTYAGR